MKLDYKNLVRIHNLTNSYFNAQKQKEELTDEILNLNKAMDSHIKELEKLGFNVDL